MPEVMPDSMIKYARPDPAHIVEALQVTAPRTREDMKEPTTRPASLSPPALSPCLPPALSSVSSRLISRPFAALCIS